MKQYRKAITAVIGAIVAVLAVANIDVDEETVAAVTTLATALLVYVIPNE